ncbi:hypothetical protein EYZ11_003573 [Aspergillus tanneri]|uniref:ABC transporter domain-containing protein n=1 Tax=Aspergillus tanneri TaxID=1220188 RepID=A0A4S3JN64_9EURO|nr:hypothetical protein EYZ11_003573 [Aspergillus tanneri]
MVTNGVRPAKVEEQIQGQPPGDNCQYAPKIGRRRPGLCEPVRQGDWDELTSIALSWPDSGEYSGQESRESPEFDPFAWAWDMFQTMDVEQKRSPQSGVVFKALNVSGSATAAKAQTTVGSALIAPRWIRGLFPRSGSQTRKHILHDLDGVLGGGELLLVLGRPGSGRSTFLKAICSELQGLELQPHSVIYYNGIASDKLGNKRRGVALYNHVVENHIPELTVRQTLEFAAAAKTPPTVTGVSRADHIRRVIQVAIAAFGLSSTSDTLVGAYNDQTISSGERKRVSIAEMALSRAPILAWNQSTRGLDAVAALELVRALRISANLTKSCHIVTTDQASQAIYNVFNKVMVLYEGRQVYYGRCDRAKDYFIQMGWHAPPRQTTADFLTAVTNPCIREPRKGMEAVVPRTAQEFEEYWKRSPEYGYLQQSIRQYEEFETHEQMESNGQEGTLQRREPYMINLAMQIWLCVRRACQRISNHKAPLLTIAVGRIVMALIIGSVYYGTPDATAGFQGRGAILFFAVAPILTSALG